MQQQSARAAFAPRIATQDVAQFNYENDQRLAPLRMQAKTEHFRGGISSFKSEEATCAVIEATPIIVERTAGEFRQSNAPRMSKLVWQLNGKSELTQDGNRSILEVGEVALYDISRPYKLDTSGKYKALILAVCLQDNPAQKTMLKQGLDNSSGLKAVKSMLLNLLDNVCDESHPTLACAVDLTQRILSQRSEPTANLAPQSHEGNGLPDSWRQRIAPLLNDTDLNPNQLAKALGISRRSLFHAFTEIGMTPSVFIRKARLNNCRKSLEMNAGEPINLAQLALENGFKDQSHFTRVFRQEFGMPPGAYMRQKSPRSASVL